MARPRHKLKQILDKHFNRFLNRYSVDTTEYSEQDIQRLKLVEQNPNDYKPIIPNRSVKNIKNNELDEFEREYEEFIRHLKENKN